MQAILTMAVAAQLEIFERGDQFCGGVAVVARGRRLDAMVWAGD